MEDTASVLSDSIKRKPESAEAPFLKVPVLVTDWLFAGVSRVVEEALFVLRRDW